MVDEILKYHAIGAGMDYALAALYLGATAVQSIETACELSIYCEYPIKSYIFDKNNGCITEKFLTTKGKNNDLFHS